MAVTVHIPGPLQKLTNGQEAVEVEIADPRAQNMKAATVASLTLALTLAVGAAALAVEPEQICGDFKVFKEPYARYAGKFDSNGRYYTIVVAERLSSGKALIFIALGDLPGRPDTKFCMIRLGGFKDGDHLYVKLSSTTSYTIRPEAGELEWQKRDKDGYITRREKGSLRTLE